MSVKITSPWGEIAIPCGPARAARAGSVPSAEKPRCPVPAKVRRRRRTAQEKNIKSAMENELKNEFNCFGFVIKELLGREDYFLIHPRDFIRELYKNYFVEVADGNVLLYFARTTPDQGFNPELTIDGVNKLQHAAIKIDDDKFKSKLSLKGKLFEHSIRQPEIMDPFRITDIKIGRISTDKQTLGKFVNSFAVCGCGSRKRYIECHLV